VLVAQLLRFEVEEQVTQVRRTLAEDRANRLEFGGSDGSTRGETLLKRGELQAGGINGLKRAVVQVARDPHAEVFVRFVFTLLDARVRRLQPPANLVLQHPPLAEVRGEQARDLAEARP